MKTFIRRIASLKFTPRAAPWLFLVVAILAYGLFIWQYGFYWDDLPISWIRYQLGPEAMAVYFSTSRPVWSLLYQITTRLLPQIPIVWQIFALLWRWLGVVILWAILRQLWSQRHQMALVAGLSFLLYPGFDFQWVSFLSSHFYIVICIFLMSYWFMIRAVKDPGHYWAWTIPALILSLLNLWMLEYFYFLDLLRIFILLKLLYQIEPAQKLITVLRRALLYWLPYLLVFLINVFYRTFVFTNVAYQNVLLSNLRTEPLKTSLVLLEQVLADLWLVTVQAWASIFRLPDPRVDGPLTTLLFVLVVLSVGVLVYFFLRRYVQDDPGSDRRAAYWAISIGFAALLLGGGPTWLASLKISLAFPASRFTMSFMLGVSLLLAGSLELIPVRFRVLLIAILVAFAAGRQVLLGDLFRRDWQAQKNLFWQMTWRAPGLKPDTLVLMNERLSLYADNSLSAPLNWIYAPEQTSDHINFALFYPTNRLGRSLTALEPGLPVHFSYIAGDFNGNTSDAVAFYYDPPACLRLLEPDLDPINRFILDDSLMRQASALSNADRVLTQPTAVMPAVYGPEPAHGWCYYFEKADLARQVEDWEEVVRLGNAAFKLKNDSPNNPVERFVFIEGYAHTGDWGRAIELSKASYRVSKDYVGPLLCRLWERIETETGGGVERDALSGEAVSKRSEALSQVKSLFACSP